MKKGFTLVELLVSILLLSIVIVFMTGFIINLRNKKLENNIDISLMVNQATISKILNYEIASLRIDSLDCEADNLSCNINFSDSTSKILEISEDKKSIKYYDESGSVKFIRTLRNDEFSEITYTVFSPENSDLEFGSLFCITIAIADNEDYNIEIYSYEPL